MTSWVQGFLVASAIWHNQDNRDRVTAAMLAIPESVAIQAWMDKYCREHPLEKVMNAAGALHWELTTRLEQ